MSSLLFAHICMSPIFGLFQKLAANWTGVEFGKLNSNTNLWCRSSSSLVIYLIDPVKDIPNLYMHRQILKCLLKAHLCIALLLLLPNTLLPASTACSSLLTPRYVTETWLVAFALRFAKGGEIRDTKTLNLSATLFRCKFWSMFRVFHLAWSTWPATKTFVAGGRNAARWLANLLRDKLWVWWKTSNKAKICCSK